jgi:toxin ParE2
VNLSVHEAAEKELLEGAKWYEDRQAGLGDQFLNEYEAAILRILAAPLSYAKVETVRTRRTIRRSLFKRFPYYIAYEALGDQIRVLAVAHGKRRPNYWLRRQ